MKPIYFIKVVVFVCLLCVCECFSLMATRSKGLCLNVGNFLPRAWKLSSDNEADKVELLKCLQRES